MITFNEDAANQICMVEGKVNDVIEIDFSENPIKATIWHVEIEDPSILEVDKDEYVPDKDKNYGRHGTHIYRFKALKAGSTKVTFKASVDVYPKDPKIREYIIVIK